MEHTSPENIKKILEFNKCGSVDELNSKTHIHLNLFHLNGYINISDIAQNAIILSISAEEVDFDKRVNFYHGSEKEEEISSEVKKLKRRVDLDASYAGDFSDWCFGNGYEHLFINSITLRHPNQVWHFGNNPFRVKNDFLYKMTERAKIEARDRNIKNYLKTKNYQEFHTTLKYMQETLNTILYRDKEIDEYQKQIKVIELKIQKLKEEKKELKETKSQSLKIIENINNNVAFEQQIPLHMISKVKFNTQKSEYDPGSDQNFEYEYLSKSAIEEMKRKNADWYAKTK